MQTLVQNAVCHDVLPPISQATGTPTTIWVPIAEFKRATALVNVGAIPASTTVDAKLQSATDASGTGASDITGAAITQLGATDDNKRAAIEIPLDKVAADGDTHLGIVLTVGGTGPALVCANLILHAAERPAVTFADEVVTP